MWIKGIKSLCWRILKTRKNEKIIIQRCKNGLKIFSSVKYFLSINFLYLIAQYNKQQKIKIKGFWLLYN